MHRRVLIAILGLVAIFGSAAPTSASVTGFTTGLNNPICTHHGSLHGHGKVEATAHFEETGGTGTNYFVSIANVLEWNGSHWVAWNPLASQKSTSFKATHLGHTWDISWTYYFVTHDVGRTFRANFVYQFWDKRSGPDRLIAHFTRTGPTCTA